MTDAIDLMVEQAREAQQRIHEFLLDHYTACRLLGLAPEPPAPPPGPQHHPT